jgi:hypothetical protein
MSTCDVSYPGRPECAADAVAVMEYGCVHEHIDTAAICRKHLDLALTLKWSCKICENGSEPHDCPIIMRERQPS